ncbi:rhomboid family intramembrane serine protease [Bdellovibrio sp. HCB337]|uniref:rhomboid family intramembrane serine protease n=1 Tax=Bdellovibrio sp. HCB337 TaxID=3394358 RepID=UPI0039A63DD8
MILPQSEPLSKFHRYPLTWTLLALNILIYFLFFAGQPDNFRNQKILETESTLITGRLYRQFFQSLSTYEQKTRAPWVGHLSATSDEQMEILGSYALRDAEFLDRAAEMPFHGDEVAIEKWRKNLESFRKFYDEDTIYSFGLNKADMRSITWITYQFSHASITHLFSNMLFLVVIGTAVEILVGSFALLVLYLLGGIVGGAAFLFYNGHGVIPMVGASASISALLAFYVVAETRLRIRYVYFISPFPGHNGFIYLPTLLIVPLFLLVDFTNLIANPEGVGGGVAYAAHAGGTVIGLILGAFSRWTLRVERPMAFNDPVPVVQDSED